VVNKYKYTPKAELKTLRFEEMSDTWLDFVAACRKGIDHEYDIVEGPMAMIKSGILWKDLFRERFREMHFGSW